MLCALLKHIDTLWLYYECFPKLLRLMRQRLVHIWGGPMDEARVLAFLMLRRFLLASLSSKENKMEKLLKVSSQLVEYVYPR